MRHRPNCLRTKLAAIIVASTSVAQTPVSRAASTRGHAVVATVGKDGKSVRVVFTDGPDLVVAMDDTGAVRFDAPAISADRRTVAWAEELQMAASYPDVAVLYVYRDGEPFVFQSPDNAKFRISDGCPKGGAMLDWHFTANGRQLYMACGFSHGLTQEYRNLYDLASGRRLGKVDVSDDTNEPPPDAPAWAKSPP